MKLWLSGESVRYIRDEETAHCRKFHFLTGRLIMYPPPPHRKGSTWLLFCFADECKTWYCESSYSPRTTYCQPHLHRALIGVTSFDRQTVRVSSFRLSGNRTGAEPCRRETLPSNVFVKSPWLDSAGGCSALWRVRLFESCRGLTVHRDTCYPGRDFSWFPPQYVGEAKVVSFDSVCNCPRIDAVQFCTSRNRR